MDGSHILRSPFPDIELPKDRSLPDFVLQKALTYGDRIAFVSICIFFKWKIMQYDPWWYIYLFNFNDA